MKQFAALAEQSKRDMMVRFQYRAMFNMSVHGYLREFWIEYGKRQMELEAQQQRGKE